jgi:hypothetical protein
VLGALGAADVDDEDALAVDALVEPPAPEEADELEDDTVLLLVDDVDPADPVAAGLLLAELVQPAVNAAAAISPETAKTGIRFMGPTLPVDYVW